MILDIISSDLSIPGQSDFVADSTALEVPVTPPGANGLDFDVPNGEKWFEAGDNVLLLAAACNIPFGFGQGTGRHSIVLNWKDAFGAFTAIPELEADSALTFPNICETLIIPEGGIFLKAPKTSGKVVICMRAIFLNVSQVGLPAVLDATAVKVQYHLTVKHTKALDVVP